VRVTGETITDEQILELRGSVTGLAAAPHIEALCDLALGSSEQARIVLAVRPRKRTLARRLCAEAWNARQGRTS
jgi:hypothetical protein